MSFRWAELDLQSLTPRTYDSIFAWEMLPEWISQDFRYFALQIRGWRTLGEYSEAPKVADSHTVLFRSIRPSRVTRQVDMAEIHRLSQVTEVVAGVEKPLVKKAKIHFFFEPWYG
jgi:hypothetical protein